jgi:hypothetical protein
MFSSTIIPTIGRPTLTRAVLSVLEQEPDLDDREVIVVNDSGRPLADAEWRSSPRVRILETDREERSMARNRGASAAKGRYLHFLDDDDWMLPGAWEVFRALDLRSGAAWLYGGYRMVRSDGTVIEERCPDECGNCFVRFMVGEWLPLQVSLFRSDTFSAVGGFVALPSLRGGNEDLHLTRRVSGIAELAGSGTLVAAIRYGTDESTTDYGNLLCQNRVSREKALRSRGAFRRLLASSRERPRNRNRWRGLAVRIYLASAAWNLRGFRVLTALGRTALGAAAAVAAGPHALTPSFWAGVTRPHSRAEGILHFQSGSERER